MATSKKRRRRRISVRSIEEKMSDRLMKIHECSPQEAWNMIRMREMNRKLEAIS